MVPLLEGCSLHACVIRSTATVLPDHVVTNEDIVERLIAGSGEGEAESERSRLRARARDIERKTGLRERRFFGPAEDPVEVAYGVLTQLLDRGQVRWGDLDAIIVSSSSIHGFPGLSQQLVARARGEHPDLGNHVRARYRQQRLHQSPRAGSISANSTTRRSARKAMTRQPSSRR